jgi:hypothetical protein
VKPELPSGVIPYLRRRFEQGDMVLFTGAGFSLAAKNQGGESVPSVSQLRAMLTGLVYPGSEPDDEDSLQHLFGLAQSRAGNRLRDLVRTQFTVDRAHLPEMYVRVLSAAWHRIYTVNVDDLELAVASSHTLPRAITSITPRSALGQGGLEVVHLNGRVDEGPENLTFTPTQYARRFPGADPLHQQCAVDVLQRPVVYIGTELNESPLWQALELRKKAEGKDLRKRSFLVTPKINRSRRDYLERELHVELIPLTFEAFYSEVFAKAESGSQKFFAAQQERSLWHDVLRRPAKVSELSVDPELSTAPGEYLLGRPPTWRDLLDGRAAERQYESEFLSMAEAALQLKGAIRPVIVLTGTAGAGKSTAMMHLALTLNGRGIDCGWIDSQYDVSPRDLRSAASLGELPQVLFIDDGGRYGNEASLLVKDIQRTEGYPLVIMGVRAGRVERISDRLSMMNVPHQELVIPLLTDEDIARVLDALDRGNRLGALKGLPRKAQIKEFRNREKANRDLLVAMLEATSGRRFESRIEEELDELAGQQRFLYSMVNIGTAYQLGLSPSQVLLGVGDPSNAALQDIQDLVRRMLVLEYPDGSLRARHRVVAERTVRYLTRTGRLYDPLLSLAMALATDLGPTQSREKPAYRTMRMLMNHDWLVRSLTAAPAKRFLGELEPYMAWDHHYWLQRGSLELEVGDLSLAENCLNQAAGIQPNDPLVQTQIAYLYLKAAVSEGNLALARERLEAGLRAIESIIGQRRHFDPHQYDIYGRQVLRWCDRADVRPEEAEDLLREAAVLVERGRKNHPGDERLRELYVQIQNRRLGH